MGYHQSDIYAKRTEHSATAAHVAFMINRMINFLKEVSVNLTFFLKNLFQEPDFVSRDHLRILTAGKIVMTGIGTQPATGTDIEPHLEPGGHFGF